MIRYVSALLLILLIIAPASGQKDIGLKEFYYPPASKLFDARHYFQTLQYYNNELAVMTLKTAKDSADMAKSGKGKRKK